MEDEEEFRDLVSDMENVIYLVDHLENNSVTASSNQTCIQLNLPLNCQS